MSNFRSRLFKEHDDLISKVEKLKLFICSDRFETLPNIERKDLKEQLKYMDGYLGVIARRVSRLCNNA